MTPLASLFPLHRLLLLGLFFAGTMSVQLSAQPVISGFSPPRNTTATAVSNNIVLTWSQAMSTATLTSGNIRVYGSMRGLYTTNASFSYSGGNTIVTVDPSQNFKHGELVSVSVTRAVRSAGGVNLASPAVWQFRAAAAQASGMCTRYTNVSLAASAYDIALGDFNSDGNLDMAAAIISASYVSVRFGDGTGNFGGGVDVPMPDVTTGIALGDFNNDGHLDFAAVAESGLVAIRLGDGAGGFSAKPNLSSLYAYKVITGDVNGDGKLDILTSNGNNVDPGIISVRLGDGAGNFGSPTNVPSLSRVVLGIALGDMDGDGDLDLASTNSSDNTVSIRLNNGAGNFSGTTEVSLGDGTVEPGPQSIGLGDLNSDGKLDLVTANYNYTTVSVRLGDGTGNFSGSTEVYMSGSLPKPYSVHLGDMNGDGNLDIVAPLINDQTVAVSLGDGAGNFATPMYAVGPQLPSRLPIEIALGDVNGDGRLDIATANLVGATSTILLNQPSLYLASHTPSTNAHSVTRASNIGLAFTAGLNPSTATGANIRIWGEHTGLISTKGVFSANGTTAAFDYTSQFKAGELVSVSVTDRVRSTTGVYLTSPTVWQFRAATIPAFGTFTTAATASVSNGNPQGIALGDVNGDGNLDFATANANGNSVSVRLGDGTGNFSGSTSVSTPSYTAGVVFGDVNNDGKLDIAATNTLSNEVSISLGDGAGNFGNTTTVQVGSNPYEVVLGDVNGDGNLDIATANQMYSSTIGSVSIRLGDGAGNFDGSDDIPTETTPKTLALGDIDGDGDLDIAAGNFNSSSISIRINNGKGNFSGSTNIALSDTSYGLPMGIAFGDVNSDGHLDFAVANLSGGNITLRLGDGAGNFSSPTIVPMGGANPYAYFVRLGDVNGDGHLDIVAPLAVDERVAISLGDGAGNFATPTYANVPHTSYSFPNAVALGDINSDGRLDIATANGSSTSATIFINEPTIYLLSHTPPTNAQNVTAATNISIAFTKALNPATITGANIRIWGEHTGLLSTKGTFSANSATATFDYSSLFKAGELVSVSVTRAVQSAAGANISSPEVWQFRTATAQARAEFATQANVVLSSGSPAAIALGDVNNDGNLDFATANHNAGIVAVRLGNGAGNFSGSTNVPVGGYTVGVALGDVNNDGNLDIAATNLTDNNVSIRLGDGAGNFSATTAVPVGPSPSEIVMSDFNGDGNLDIATANSTYSSLTGSISIRLGDGTGNFSGSTEVPTGYVPSNLAVGDIDNDGDLDLAAANFYGYSVSIRLNDGMGNFSGTANMPISQKLYSQPFGIAFGDLNKDGYLDFATANYSGSTIAVHFGDGTGSFNSSVEIPVNGQYPYPYVARLGDMNGDGNLDIVTTVPNDENVAVSLGDGAGNFGDLAYFTIPHNPYSFPQFATLGDINNDGLLDIATANGSGTSATILLNKPLNATPVAVHDQDSTCIDEIAVIPVLRNDTDADNNALSITAFTQPLQGVVSMAPGDSALVYTPPSAFEGIATFTYTISDGAGAEATGTVTVVVRSMIIADAGEDVVLCAGSEVQLNGRATSSGGGTQFSWWPAAGLSNTAIAAPVAHPDSTTLYILTVLSDDGCHDIDSVLVTVAPALQYSVSSDTAICAGSSVQIVASGGAGYRWWPSSGLSDTAIANPLASPVVSTTYLVEITSAFGCRVVTTITVTVASGVTASAGNNVSVCAGGNVQLMATGGTQYSWSPSSGLSNTSIANPIASPTTTTTYTVTVSNAAGCSAVTTVTVTVEPIHLAASAILEGAYNGSAMNTGLQAQDFLPASQPYNTSPFNYNGSETISSLPPASIVDWVLVEMRTQTSTSSLIARRAALLRSNGAIVDTDGISPVSLPTLTAGTYYVVVRHRNHIPVMSAIAVGVNGECSIDYNFTSSQTAAYRDFLDGQKMLAPSVYGLAGGDVNADGIVNATDRVEVRSDSGMLGYLHTDISLDGIVNAADRVIVRSNGFVISQVP